MLCGISLAFARVSPTEGKVAHVLRTRSPRAHTLYCYKVLRVRLACVKHAASVRSEPGSNSHLKLVLVNFSRNLRFGKTEKRTVDRSVSQKNRTGSGLFYPIVKEQDFLSSRKECRQTPILQMRGVSVNHDDAVTRGNFAQGILLSTGAHPFRY